MTGAFLVAKGFLLAAVNTFFGLPAGGPPKDSFTGADDPEVDTGFCSDARVASSLLADVAIGCSAGACGSSLCLLLLYVDIMFANKNLWDIQPLVP